MAEMIPKVVVQIDTRRDSTRRVLKTLLREVRQMSEKLTEVQAALDAQGAQITALQAVVDAKQEAIAAAIAALEAKIAAAGAVDAELQAILDTLKANTAQLADVQVDVAETPVPVVE